MHPERRRIYRLLIPFVVFWAALAIVVGALNKAEVDLEPGAGSDSSATEIAFKICAVIFTAVAAAAGGAVRKLWRRLPVPRAGNGYPAPVRFKPRRRPPPHGFSLLRTLQIIIV